MQAPQLKHVTFITLAYGVLELATAATHSEFDALRTTPEVHMHNVMRALDVCHVRG